MKKTSLPLLFLLIFLINSCESTTNSSSSNSENNTNTSNLTLDKSSISLYTCDTTTISATIAPQSPQGEITWSSADSTIAIIDQNGVVVATGAGTTTITASMGTISSLCSVNVSPAIFVTGTQSDSLAGSSGIVWRNGVSYLNITSDNNEVYCNDSYIYKGIVYSTGYNTTTSGIKLMVWENGVEDENFKVEAAGSAASIIVEDDAITVGGSQFIGSVQSAYTWSNNNSTNLGSSYSYSNINDIFIDNSTIYSVGVTSTPSANNQPTLWSGTTATLLEQSGNSGYANGVYVANNNIYVVGSVNGEAVMWENGTQTTLSNSGSALGIYVDNANVYVCGYTESTTGAQTPTYWVNGTATTLSGGIGTVNSIYPYKGDVYMAGTVFPSGSNTENSVMWKNSTMTTLSNSIYNSNGNSIFVK